MRWKVIPGFEKYEASDSGLIRVASSKKLVPQSNNHNGYLQVSIRDNDGKHKSRRVHRLVMLAFVGDSKDSVNHINENKKDNRLENLEYLPIRDNIKYGTGEIRKSKAHKKPVLQINIETGDIIARHESSNDAALSLGLDKSNITKVCRGKARQTGGFKWEYDSKGEW